MKVYSVSHLPDFLIVFLLILCTQLRPTFATESQTPLHPTLLPDSSEHYQARLSSMEERLLFSGFPVDYSFNETVPETKDFDYSTLISVPGCPASDEIVPNSKKLHSFPRNFWVQYGVPPKCYLVGTKGPCHKSSRIGPKMNSVIGVCKPACWFKFPRGNKPFSENETTKYKTSDGYAILVDDGCSYERSQDRCNNGEVLVLNEGTNSAVCEAKKLQPTEPTQRPYPTRRTPPLPPMTFSPQNNAAYNCERNSQRYSVLLDTCVPLNRYTRRQNVG